jgi:hypothetical protein
MYFKYHRLNIEFDDTKLKLNKTRNIPELKSKIQKNRLLIKIIDNIIRYVITSLFYFELNSNPEKFDTSAKV